jgi:hypothetical protein
VTEAAERRKRQTAEVAIGEAQQRMRFALEAAGVGRWEFDLESRKAIWSDLLGRLGMIESASAA